ncbi:MAG: methyltransferase domain-containing protein, partial [Bacteroidota bacterium]|nr:methyltransferase domain-containing protein [Bacteroidota bacterium]
YTFLKEKSDIFSKKIKLLHISPEGSLKSLLQKSSNIDYYCGDKFEEGYQDYYYDRDVFQIDITNIKYKDDEFDVLICNHVLEHVDDDEKALQEIYRVLKPGGWAILQVPISLTLQKTLEQPTSSPAERERLFGQFDHVRLYGQDYKERLAKVGFIVKTHNPKRDNWDIDINRLAINPMEVLYLAHKSI